MIIILCCMWIASPVVFSNAHAAVTISGAEVTVTLTEPSTDAVGGPLMDLEETWVTWEINDTVRGGLGENPCGAPIPATTRSGGEVISTSCIIPTQRNAETAVVFRGRSKDETGNISDPPAEEVAVIDLLATASPTF